MSLIYRMARRLALMIILFTSAPLLAADGKLRIGWTAWADAEAVSKVAERLLRHELGMEVEMVFDNIGNIYQKLADGEVDVMLMGWLPIHNDYVEQHGRVFEDLGVAYGGGLVGWVVPAYVPEDVLGSFDDLRKPEVKRRLRGRIAGLGETAGMMESMREAMEAYELGGYTLVYGNEVSAIAAIRRAVREERWVLAASWRPHWMFANWELRFIEDPKKLFGDEQSIHIFARPGFSADFPRAARFLGGFQIPLNELQEVMFNGTRKVLDDAISDYLQSNPERVRGWLANAR